VDVLHERCAGLDITDDVRGVSPLEVTEGRKALAEGTAEALGRYARTQHIATDIVTDVVTAPEGLTADGTTATVSWNALMTHVHLDTTLKDRKPGANPLFTVGGYYRAELRRTPLGRRFSRMAIEVIWPGASRRSSPAGRVSHGGTRRS
jgi:hypothetical protein